MTIITTQPPNIIATKVVKWYGKVNALQSTNLELSPGVWALLGPNGAGKSTLLNLFAGQLRPSLGRVEVCGHIPFANPAALRRIGLCPEANALYNELTAFEFLSSMAELSGLQREEAKARSESILRRFDLHDVASRRLSTFSRGMRQRVKLAQSLIHDPDVLLLDEPWTGADPVSRRMILEEIRQRGEAGALVVVSTHILHEAQSLTDKMVLIAKGELVADGKVDEIRSMLDEFPVQIRVISEQARDLASHLLLQEGVGGVRVLDDRTVQIDAKVADLAYDAVARCVAEYNLPIDELTTPDATLEALFHYLIERQRRGVPSGHEHGAHIPSRGAQP